MRTTLKVLSLMALLVGVQRAAVAGFYSTPALPVIDTANVVNVLTFGAVGDNVTTNTTAIQNAINHAAAGARKYS